MLNFLIGDVRENATRELDDGNYDFVTGKRKRDLGDIIGDTLTGRGAAMDKAVQDLHVERLKREYGTAIDEINANTPSTPAIKIDEKTDPRILEQQIKVGTAKAKAYKNAKTLAVSNGVSIPEGMTDPDAITKHVFDETTKRADEKLETERLRNLNETKRQEGRADLIRLENQQMQLKRDADSKDLQIMQMMREDKRSARDRKDRMFMQLMAGLQNLGQAFTI